MSVLFGNLFDNAICAAQKAQSPYISVSIYKKEEHALIQFKNTISASVLAQNPTLKTTQKNAGPHGFGIRNIKKIVARYEGLVQFREEYNLFIVDILLRIGGGS